MFNASVMVFGNNSSTNNRSNEAIELGMSSYAWLKIMFICVCVVGVLFNATAIAIIVGGKKFGKDIKVQLLNLAVTDLMAAILTGTFVFILLPYADSEILCKIHQFSYFTIYTASLLFHAIIGAERLVAVYFPLRMRFYRRKHAITVIIVTWVVVCLMHTEVAYYSVLSANPYAPNQLICELDTNGVFTVPKLLVPSFCILIMYTLIAIKLQRRSKSQINQQAKNKPATTSRSTMIMLAVNGLVAACTFTPYGLWFIFVALTIPSNAAWYSTAYIFCISLPLINCFITPFIYFIFNKDFKEDGKYLLVGFKRKLCRED